MKFLVIFFLVVGAVLAAPPKPIHRGAAAPARKGPHAEVAHKEHHHHKRAVDERNAAITDQHFESDPEGNFQYNYETQNGISGRAVGAPKALGGNPPEIAEVIQGSFSWTSPEGKLVNVQYTADENGYRSKVQL